MLVLMTPLAARPATARLAASPAPRRPSPGPRFALPPCAPPASARRGRIQQARPARLRRVARAQEGASSPDMEDGEGDAPVPPPAPKVSTEDIKKQLPWVVDRELLGPDVTYTSPIKEHKCSGTAQYLLFMKGWKESGTSRLGPDFKYEIMRAFKPTPTSVIVRWRATWDYDKDGSPSNRMTGSTRLELDEEGRVTEHEDTWETAGEAKMADVTEEDEDIVFSSVLYWYMAQFRPGVDSLPQTLKRALQKAAWYSLKDSSLPDVGTVGANFNEEEVGQLAVQAAVIITVLSAGLGIYLSYLLNTLLAGGGGVDPLLM